MTLYDKCRINIDSKGKYVIERCFCKKPCVSKKPCSEIECFIGITFDEAKQKVADSLRHEAEVVMNCLTLEEYDYYV